MSELDHTLELLGDLVACPTVSSESNLACIDMLAERLEKAGARVEVFKDETGEKANLYASLGPDVKGGILLSGHSDVVPVEGQDWSSDPFAMTEANGRLHGRGTCDMKGFIAACVAMAPQLAAQASSRPLHFAFTHDEEVGCLGAKSLADQLKNRENLPSVAIIGEPTSMRVVEGHKGCCEYTTRFSGRSGHGSDPAAGVNAVEYASRYIARLMELRETLKARTPPASPFEPPWTTINTGALIGGHAHNVIPAQAEVQWEMRPVAEGDASFVRGELQRYINEMLLPEMQAIAPEAAIWTETVGETPGLMPMSEGEAAALACALTGSNGGALVPFNTEAGIFQQLGIDVIVCGPGSIEQAHKPDEYLEISQLQQCLAMLERLGPRLA
ncbi:acetylornithine deacetylase [Oceanicola sp. 502str15]|uniref:acetylornithine deacetylase n=1 Tax=Oceanicola sp. 502str15 TaxID=2696061 RepID=UPI0020961BD1|nr:acetylornithine deacetylase [Oceanicola sp. 502str15]MCO6381566.1 acetylornithine deacetylase [Oceanicola sp. 502str15]